MTENNYVSNNDQVRYDEGSFSSRINDLENYYADSALPDDLKDLYAIVQKNCDEFRNEVFFKKLDDLDESLVH